MRTYRLLLLTILFCLWGGALHVKAQNSESKEAFRKLPNWTVKFSPSSLIAPYTPAIQFALEQRLGGKHYVQYEAGYLVNMGFARDLEINRLSGLRIRAGYRYYFRLPGPYKIGWFMEPQLMYQYIDTNIEGDFCRFDCAYQERIGYNMQHTTYAAYMNFGSQFFIAERWMLEFGLGGGLHYLRRNYQEVPPDATFSTNGALVWQHEAGDEGGGLGFRVIAKVGYILK